ncbi:hypothetical protein T643_A3412 [Klebsiella pneumoniae MRSN 1319]|nr:hypothetical protein T643_A3412 [Klebsiella pneumoniae MRSN 1319]
MYSQGWMKNPQARGSVRMKRKSMHPISNSSVSWLQRLMYRKRIFMLLTMI